MDFKLTRFAPTPSGFIHLGNLYSFLVTKALAEKTGAKILLRIDDLDRDRYRTEYVQDIFDTLDFMEISYDQGPKTVQEFEQEWSQIHRMNSYLQALEQIRSKNLVFACDCTRKKIQQLDSSGYYLGHCQVRNIPLERNETCWRMDTFDTDFIKINTYSEGEKSYTLPEDSAFFIVRKKDKLPAYQLTSLIDDTHYGVNLIVRGNDLLGSTLDQQILANGLGINSFQEATFHHHPLLKGPKNKKLSKSDGAISIQFLRKEGKKPADIYQIIGEMIGSTEPISSFEMMRKHLIP
ncbi:glutamate--tRNA ligase family protein [Algoriphagus sp. D3-2-R+10]|uniref:glutamate--tRNA ligase family protein n=1 Tax=Algoriphagus aurantiacus TaxID=3103948 RepID=UPI002B3D89D3|nr:glutamate--tRNA ligase family protein [Algoriphagus sp. D3-2-R+10]MEB2775900.1 glutamate--tRNA ligase family protein [Algoriphagus sp. D3-2-R+10]